MFGWEYPPLHSGGLGVACQGLVRGLVQAGVHITLVLPQAGVEGEENVEVLSPELCSILRVRSHLRPYETPERYAARLQGSPASATEELYGWDLGDAVESFASLSVELTKHTNPDVIHCHDWMTFEAGIRASRHHHVPIVMHIHATEFDRTDFHPNEWIAQHERNGLLLADKVIAVSNYTKRLLVAHYGIPEHKIAVVHNAHDPCLCSHTQIVSQRGVRRPPIVLFLGRLTIQKNPWQFLEVAHRVHQLRPDVQFVMAGDGPMLSELIERAIELGLHDCVVFTGKIQHDEVHALYRLASCFVMPSLSEPFGLVALEAIAHGTPVVLSKQSGASEVLTHCFKVDFWDTEKMSDCILTILRDPPLAEQLRSEAPRILKRLTWQTQATRVHALYESLL